WPFLRGRSRAMSEELAGALRARFGEDVPIPEVAAASVKLTGIARHRPIRSYSARPVAPGLVRMLAAVALSAPPQSELPHGDIVIVQDAAKRAALAALLPDNPWAARAPAFAVFCGNNRRQRRLHELPGHPFANDHLDAFFNAAVDAGIVLATFVAAAEAVGLG